jgi:uncharacterized protein DUF6088
MAENKLRDSISSRIDSKAPFGVWTPTDFLDLGSRDAVDKALQRVARAGEIRRIARGLYDKPQTSSLTGGPTTPDYRQIIDAIARRDQARMLVSGMTAANDLQLTTAVPSRVVVHTDVRLRSIRVGNLVIEFKKTAPSRLYWAGRPAMRIVQALHWMKDVSGDKDSVMMNRLRKMLIAPEHGTAIRADLRAGMPTLPTWMQSIVRQLLDAASDDAVSPSPPTFPSSAKE